MSTEKDTILADLYGIRAGLSVISQYADEIKECQADIEKNTELAKKAETLQQENSLRKKNLEDRLQSLELMEQRCEKECDIKNEELKFHERQISYVKDELQDFQNNRKKAIKKETRIDIVYYNLYPWWCWVFVIVWAGLGSLGGLVATLIKNITSDKPPEVAPEAYWAMGIGASVAIILFTIQLIFSAYKGKEYALERVEEKENELRKKIRLMESELPAITADAIKKLNEVRYDIAQCRRDIEECKAQAKQLSLNLEIANKTEQERLLINTQQTNRCAELSKDMKLALNSAYDGLISESDWQNVDLLIYYLETGRADNVKDGLLLVDKQLQADQITRAITHASSQIHNSITTAFETLGTAIVRSFSVISDQLSSLTLETRKLVNETRRSRLASESIIVQNDELLASNQEILRASEKQTQALIDASEAQTEQMKLNNALIEKSNATSDQLVNDLRYGQQFWRK